jgi:hypothetical protein
MSSYTERYKMENQSTFDYIAKVLWLCFLLTIGLLVLWFLVYLIGADFAFRIHTLWFDIDRSAFDAMNYYGMALLKTVAIVFFLVPFVAMKMVAKRAGT